MKEIFLTYRGISGRDLKAIAIGLKEAQDEKKISGFRITHQTNYLRNFTSHFKPVKEIKI